MEAADSPMEDTESSDFLSSSGSFCSSVSTSTTFADHENPNYVDFNVFQSGSLTKTGRAEQDFQRARPIPNSRLNTSSHPVLVRLENEYQARRSLWQQHTAQYCTYPPEVEERTSHPRRNTQDKQLKDWVFPDGSSLEAQHRLKRQRRQESRSPVDWWKERKEQNLPVSDGDRIFAQKCQELQGFIKPLTELLNGLKRGRYDRGLSSFQQSVAMDRIQRIVGVLQKPEMGERYLGTLLQVEMMLKIWFPGVTSSSSSSSSSSSDFDMEEPQSKMAKHPQVGTTEHKSCQVPSAPRSSSPMTSTSSECHAAAQVHTDCLCCKERLQALPTMNLTWMHTAPICNPPLSQVDLHHLSAALGQGQDLVWPNGSHCGIIFLVQSSQKATLPARESDNKVGKPSDLQHCREGTQEQRPDRSQSTPAVFVMGDQPDFGQMKTQCRSFPHLPTCTQISGGENT